jgi:hypothetical protein
MPSDTVAWDQGISPLFPVPLAPLEKELPKQLRYLKVQNALFSVPFRSIVLIFLMK